MEDSFLDKIKGENKVVKTALILNVCFYFLVSLISMVCSVELYRTLHDGFIPYLTAFSFELGQVVALFSLSVLSKQNKTLTYIMFVILTFFQIVANTYSGFKYITDNPNPTTLIFFKSTLGMLVDLNQSQIVIYSAFLFVGMLPIIPLLSIKSLINYLSPDKVLPVVDKKIIIPVENNIQTEEVLETLPTLQDNNIIVDSSVKNVKKKSSKKNIINADIKLNTPNTSYENVVTNTIELDEPKEKHFDISSLENYNKSIIQNTVIPLQIEPQIVQREPLTKKVIVSPDKFELI